MKYLNILFISILIFFITACDDDFLDVQSPNLNDQAVWSDPALAEAFVVGLYTSIRITDKEPGHNGGDTPAGFGRGFHWAMWCSITDEAVYSNDDATYLVQRGQLSPSNYGFTSTVWGRSYRAIREINLALQNINNGPFTDNFKKRLSAELHFIRAYRYFDLFKGFGGIPLIGDRITNVDDTNFSELYKRNTIKETADYIVNELNMALSMGLPVSNNGRVTEGAAMTLKSRVLLYAASPLYTGGTDDSGKWTAAAMAAKAVIDLNRYSLVTNLDVNSVENFRKYFVTKTNTSEDIFTRFYLSESNSGGRAIPIERMNGPNGSGGWGGNCPMQNLVDDFEMINGLPIDDVNSGYNSQNPYANRDPRFYASIYYNNSMIRDRVYEPFLPGGKDSPNGNEPWNTSKTGYLLRKFIQEDITLNDWNKMGASPWRYMRYAEVLLNYAEAQNEAAGPDASVYNAINTIRSRAGMPDLPTGLNKAQMRKRIQNERRVELAFEEHRYFDVRRWMIAMEKENKPAEGISITKNGDGSFTYAPKTALDGKLFQVQHYWFPIPLEEVTTSGGLLQQNPNY